MVIETQIKLAFENNAEAKALYGRVCALQHRIQAMGTGEGVEAMMPLILIIALLALLVAAMAVRR